MRAIPTHGLTCRLLVVSLTSLLSSVEVCSAGNAQFAPQIWPRREISYCIEAGDATLESLALQAIGDVEALTPVRFKRLTYSPDRLTGCVGKPPEGCVRFIRPPQDEPTRCAATPGWRGKGFVSHVYVGHKCLGETKKGSVIHEIGHVLGLFHEHTRFDRNQYFNVNMGAIMKNDPNDLKNYSVQSLTDSDQFSAYDPYSIMQYPPHSNMTLTSLGMAFPPDPDGLVVGQRVGLSRGDRALIRAKYSHLPP